jgi:hypothetical protein
MKSTCISHPKNEPLIVIRAWQMEACGKNACAAALLSFFEYWHNVRIEASDRARQSNAVALAAGDIRYEDDSLLQFHTSAQLERGIMIYKDDTIREAIIELVKLEFLSVRDNPNPKYSFDRTRYFLFHPEKVEKWLATRSRKIGDDYRRIGDGEVKNRESLNKVETSSETTQALGVSKPAKKKKLTFEEIWNCLIIPYGTPTHFVDELRLWVEYRHKRRGSHDWPKFFQAQLDNLLSLPTNIACMTMSASRLNGWQGLFPERFLPKTGSTVVKESAYARSQRHFKAGGAY